MLVYFDIKSLFQNPRFAHTMLNQIKEPCVESWNDLNVPCQLAPSPKDQNTGSALNIA